MYRLSLAPPSNKDSYVCVGGDLVATRVVTCNQKTKPKQNITKNSRTHTNKTKTHEDLVATGGM